MKFFIAMTVLVTICLLGIAFCVGYEPGLGIGLDGVAGGLAVLLLPIAGAAVGQAWREILSCQ